MARPNVRMWLSDAIDDDVGRAIDRLAASDDVVAVAVMPDVHLAADVCVGVAMATTRLLYPSAVGGDIGCGMAAVQLDVGRVDVDNANVAAHVLAGFERVVPIMVQSEAMALTHELLHATTLSLHARARRQASLQLGTLGRGNHFLELQVDEGDGVWLTVHSGSRGIGQGIRDFYLEKGTQTSSGLVAVDVEGELGRGYLADLQWALAFAAESRRVILERAAAVLGAVVGANAMEETRIECEHNHVRSVGVNGQSLWVHRKGATSAKDDDVAIIPGSMGATTFHVRGRGCAASLHSSSHGAGRAMSRSEARRRLRVADLDDQVRGLWYDRRKARALIDEAPSAYKDITKVMRAQAELVRIERRLRPLLSYKGGTSPKPLAPPR